MKSKIKKILAIGLAAAPVLTVAHADEIDCDGTLVPQVCRIFAGNGGGPTVSGILTVVFSIVIAALVIFILFQIVKAVFEWIGKSSDDKARQAAIKSITNAIVAGVVLLVSILVVIIGANILDIPTPAPQYACYKDGDVSATMLTDQGSLLPGFSGKQEIPDVIAVEGSGNNSTWKGASGKTGNVNANAVATLQKIKCRLNAGEFAGKEAGSQGTTGGPYKYIVVSRGGIKK